MLFKRELLYIILKGFFVRIYLANKQFFLLISFFQKCDLGTFRNRFFNCFHHDFVLSIFRSVIFGNKNSLLILLQIKFAVTSNMISQDILEEVLNQSEKVYEERCYSIIVII